MKLTQFSGLANKVTPEALPEGALAEALNVDVDDAGRLRRRRGATLIHAGGFHSLLAVPDEVGYVVKNGDLYRFGPSMSLMLVQAGVGDDHLSYLRVGDRTYAKSRTQALVLLDTGLAQAWGVPLVDTFTPSFSTGDAVQVAVVYRRDSDGLEGGAVSAIDTNLTPEGSVTISNIPIVAGHTASVYLTTVNGETLSLAADGVTESVTVFSDSLSTGVQLRTMNMSPPTGAGPLAWLFGRILIADGAVLWATEPYQYELVDALAGYKMMESDITFLGSVVDGVFIGTEGGVFFMSGQFEGAKLERVSTRRAPKQAPSLVDMASVLKGEEQGVGVMFLTDGGVCVGQPGGKVINLTNKIFEFPKASEVAVMARVQDGLNQFVGVASHPSVPTGSARFGDFVDAEIVRFKGV